jgi:hypothetical protein
MATIMGMDSLIIAFFGFPKSVCTPLVAGVAAWSDGFEFGMKRLLYPANKFSQRELLVLLDR